METKSISNYFFFGLSFWYLREVQAGYSIHSTPDDKLGYVLCSIDEFISYLDELNLPVTRTVSKNRLVILQEMLKATDKDSVLDEKQAKELQEIAKELETTLIAELAGLSAYVVTSKRIDVDKLQNNVHLLFAPAVFEKLPTVAQFDLREAGKCIVFERSTAAAFHLMRATESVLREYYLFHVKRNRVKVLLWGAITKKLQSKSKFLKDEKRQVLFKNLDNIRLSFRNPTQHPEKIYDIQEVQDLWGLCVDVINRMAAELPTTNER
jgi:hypothetical protein